MGQFKVNMLIQDFVNCTVMRKTIVYPKLFRVRYNGERSKVNSSLLPKFMEYIFTSNWRVHCSRTVILHAGTSANSNKMLVTKHGHFGI